MDIFHFNFTVALPNNNPNQNTPGIKKVVAKNLKKGHAEKYVKSKWAAKASCDGIKSFDNDD